MRRRRYRLWIIVAVMVVALVLLTPLLAGYLGPTAAAYAQTWRPWRTHLSVQSDAAFDPSSGEVMLMVTYFDSWPGAGRSPGEQTDFQTVTRASRLVPWMVTGHGTGP